MHSINENLARPELERERERERERGGERGRYSKLESGRQHELPHAGVSD